jgi:hypothetical protein
MSQPHVLCTTPIRSKTDLVNPLPQQRHLEALPVASPVQKDFCTVLVRNRTIADVLRILWGRESSARPDLHGFRSNAFTRRDRGNRKGSRDYMPDAARPGFRGSPELIPEEGGLLLHLNGTERLAELFEEVNPGWFGCPNSATRSA